jgi:hypothetical protein
MFAGCRNKNRIPARFDRDFELLQEFSSFARQSDYGNLRLWQKLRL